MKKLILFIFVFVLIHSPEISAQTNQVALDRTPLTLSDCYKLALKQSETVAKDSEVIKEAEAHFLQSLGALLPQVSFVASETRNNSSSNSSYNRYSDRKFVFKQTLFSGFKEFAGMSGSKLEYNQRVNEKKRAEQLLFVDVVDAFYLLMQQREDLRILETIKESLIERINDLEQREKIGRSRPSEVVNTELQLYNLEAEIESVKSQELIARQLLEFLIGRPVEEITDYDAPLLSLNEAAYYVTKAESRPDVLADGFAWGVAKKEVSSTISELFPTVSLEGNYYTHRSTVPTDSKWYTLLKVDVPIFEGTTTYGLIKEAKAKSREDELEFMHTKRLAIQDIQDSYARAQTSISRKDALGKAFKSAELNYSLQKQDYESNLVNNIDVLLALQTLEDTRRNFTQAQYESKRLYWELQVAAGEIPI